MVHILYMKQYNSYVRKHVKFEAKLDQLLILPHFHDVLNGKTPWSINQMFFCRRNGKYVWYIHLHHFTHGQEIGLCNDNFQLVAVNLGRCIPVEVNIDILYRKMEFFFLLLVALLIHTSVI